MTLIAITCSRTHAECVTDTANYTPHATVLGRSTKHVTLDHLDAAILSQGDCTYGDGAKMLLLGMSNDVATFDELVDGAPTWLAGLWADLTDLGRVDPAKTAVVFLVGYSTRDQRFTATAFPSIDGFRPTQLNGTFVMPAPYDSRPSDFERYTFERDYADRDGISEAAETWSRRPMLAPPRSHDDWIALAERSRSHRSLGGTSIGHVIVAGDLHHLRLSRGTATAQRIHTFNDTGQELVDLVHYSCHPLAQAKPCHCGSGQRFIDCHLADSSEHHARPCCCGRSDTTAFSDCCAITAGAVAQDLRDASMMAR